MPPPPSDRPRGPIVLAVMGVIIVSVVVFIVVVANPGARRTALSRPDGGDGLMRLPTPTQPQPTPAQPQPSPPETPTSAPRPLPTFPTADAGPAPTLDARADQAAFEAAVHDVIRRNSAVVFECYREATERTPDLHGRFVARFVIGPDGRIISTALGESDVADERVNYCIRMGLIGRATFPPNVGGRFQPVDHPFMLPPQ